MMTPHRNSSHGETDSAAGPGKPSGAEGWLAQHLPARGFERIAFLVLAALVLALKVLAIYHFRVDSDETQHAHVVWSWATGQLQYRDFFDNHMPLFQMACAPLMALLGQRADIMVALRWAMLPLFFACLRCVYRLTEILYSRQAAPWSALLAATLAKFFYTSTEFRTDDLWAVFWLVSLVVAVSGEFTVWRAAAFGLMLGLAFAVSLKTVVLTFALGIAAVPALALAWRRGERRSAGWAAARLGAMAGAVAIPPAATVLYFAWRGAFWIMYYCVIKHNVVPGLKRWGSFSLHLWYFPLALPLAAGYAWLIFRQTPDTRLAMSRTVIALTPWLFLALLLSYWPDITREDDLPYIPLVPLSLIPLVLLAGNLVRDVKWRGLLLTYGLPAVVLGEFLVTCRTENLRHNRLEVTTHDIADVLALTNPDDYVMDAKGEYVYRRRAYYWVLEPITKTRVRMGTIRADIPQRLVKTGTKICYFRCTHPGSLAAQFIVSNYLPFDARTRDMGVLGKVIGQGPAEGTFRFEVAIPQSYAVVTETGHLEGNLDGKPYTGPVWLGAGSHEFRRTGGGGRAAIFLQAAHDKGFSPLFDDYEKIAKREGTLPQGSRTPEVQ